METLTTRQAADQAGVTVRQWHHLTEKHGIEPHLKAPGVRGAMFWRAEQVNQVRQLARAAA